MVLGPCVKSVKSHGLVPVGPPLYGLHPLLLTFLTMVSGVCLLYQLNYIWRGGWDYIRSHFLRGAPQTQLMRSCTARLLMGYKPTNVTGDPTDFVDISAIPIVYPIGSIGSIYGIYANMTGVYWWDPCYHIYIYSSTMDPSWVWDKPDSNRGLTDSDYRY